MQYEQHGNCEIRRMTRGTIPNVPFARIKNHILGVDYHLSLVFPTLRDSIALHMRAKHQPTPANILSFPLDDNTGEIFMTLSQVRTTAREHGITYKQFLPYLFIHGCTHLQGYDHGPDMEIQEKKYCDVFDIVHPLFIS